MADSDRSGSGPADTAQRIVGIVVIAVVIAIVYLAVAGDLTSELGELSSLAMLFTALAGLLLFVIVSLVRRAEHYGSAASGDRSDRH